MIEHDPRHGRGRTGLVRRSGAGDVVGAVIGNGRVDDRRAPQVGEAAAGLAGRIAGDGRAVEGELPVIADAPAETAGRVPGERRLEFEEPPSGASLKDLYVVLWSEMPPPSRPAAFPSTFVPVIFEPPRFDSSPPPSRPASLSTKDESTTDICALLPPLNPLNVLPPVIQTPPPLPPVELPTNVDCSADSEPVSIPTPPASRPPRWCCPGRLCRRASPG